MWYYLEGGLCILIQFTTRQQRRSTTVDTARNERFKANNTRRKKTGAGIFGEFHGGRWFKGGCSADSAPRTYCTNGLAIVLERAVSRLILHRCSPLFPTHGYGTVVTVVISSFQHMFFSFRSHWAYSNGQSTTSKRKRKVKNEKWFAVLGCCFFFLTEMYFMRN